MKLSEENIKLISDLKKTQGLTTFYDACLSLHFRLLEMQNEIDELEKENAELKAHVNQQQTNLDRLWHLAEDLGACSEYLKVNFASGSYIPKQSLAQHDKEVAVKAVEEFVTCLVFDGDIQLDATFYIEGQGADTLSEFRDIYLEQLQEQE